MGLKEITPVMIHLPGYTSDLKELELRLSQVSSEWLLARVSFQLVWGKYVPNESLIPVRKGQIYPKK